MTIRFVSSATIGALHRKVVASVCLERDALIYFVHTEALRHARGARLGWRDATSPQPRPSGGRCVRPIGAAELDTCSLLGSTKQLAWLCGNALALHSAYPGSNPEKKRGRLFFFSISQHVPTTDMPHPLNYHFEVGEESNTAIAVKFLFRCLDSVRLVCQSLW